MSELICPFSATLAKDVFACAHAKQIIRRGGAEFACGHAALHAHCSRLFVQLKNAALPALDLEDDLLQVPHGVHQKIQFGGLLGLQRLISDRQSAVVDNIGALVEAARAHYDDIDSIPCEQLVEEITHYKLTRRCRR